MDKRFWGIMAIIALVFSGIFIFANNNKASAPSGAAGNATNHVIGEGKSGVTLVEYGDYQCPACYQFEPIVQQVVQKYTTDITFQFRNFPLFQIHPNAMAGARAAEAADMQGKFWEMHNLLYQNQQSWSTGSNPQSEFEQYAKQLGLNVEKFKTDFKSKAANDRIQADLRAGNDLSIDSTPTFFVNGKKISNPTSVDAFNKVIETAIEQKTGKKPSTSDAAAAPAASETTTNQ